MILAACMMIIGGLMVCQEPIDRMLRGISGITHVLRLVYPPMNHVPIDEIEKLRRIDDVIILEKSKP